ncbi:nickel pincer cofactor biosynthesis protein LarC [Clostridiaceae bacterium 35-E11]
MKILYLECNMGASGDMFMGALYDICEEKQTFLDKMEALNLPGVHIHVDQGEKCGVSGTSFAVHIHGEEEHSHDVAHGHHHSHDHDHHHSYHHHDHDLDSQDHSHEHTHGSMGEIRSWIENAPVSNQVKKDALGVYEILAQAEAAVHGTTPNEVHFHEVGTLDAVADIVGGCILMEMINPDRVMASPVHVGSGQVQCAHGILPVPAPATAKILTGIPIYSGEIQGELCTPTGAALLKYFVSSYGAMPVMVLEKVGYGLGKKDFPVANCLRAMVGQSEEAADEIVELTCNVDDMTGEAVGYALEKLMEEGALDVFITPIQMKKNRPAMMLTCMCRTFMEEQMARLMLKHTMTLGVRRKACTRMVMSWEIVEKETPYGIIRIKRAWGHGIEKIKPEYEDVRSAAEKHDVSFETVYRAALV